MRCKLNNFNIEEHSGCIIIPEYTTGMDLDTFMDSLKSKLKGVPFSLDFSNSIDPGKYVESINSLIKYVIENLKGDEEIIKSRITKGKIAKSLRDEYYPTDTDINIKEVLKGIDLITEEERADMQFEQTVKDIYGTSKSMLDLTRQSQFQRDLTSRLIIDTSRGVVISGNADLNEAIKVYLSEQYAIIKNFIDSLPNEFKFDSSLFPNSLFKKNDGDSNGYTINPKYINLLLMFYNYLKSEDRTKEIEDSWISFIKGEGSGGIYEAINAYINLVYFDNALQKSFKGYIKINDSLEAPIVEVEKNNRTRLVYKYKISSGNKNMGATFTADDKFRDAITEMGDFSKMLIESIPIYEFNPNTNNGYVAYGHLQTKLLVATFSLLHNIAPRLLGTGNDKYIRLANAILYLHEHPENIRTIFSIIFENKDNKLLLEKLNSFGFDKNYVNFLYSVYRTVYKNKNSWFNIELRYKLANGITDRYNTVSCIEFVISGNIPLNYAETTYNADQLHYQTKIKDTYGITSYKFDIINPINDYAINGTLKELLLKKYIITKQGSDKSYTIQIPEIQLDILAKKGLLYNDIDATGVLIDALAKLKNLDLTPDVRARLLDPSATASLTEEELQLKNIIEFIDDMLQTSFGKSEGGLLELQVFLRMNNNGLKELVTTAARALLVMDIYDKFSKAKKANGEPYSFSEIKEFLIDNKLYEVDFTKMKKSTGDLKRYFKTILGLDQLSVMSNDTRWAELLSKVRAILAGDTIRSVTSDLSGNKIPNTSPYFLGGNIHSLIMKGNQPGTASSRLLFATRPELIKTIAVNTDVKMMTGEVKSIKTATESELIHDAMINKFMLAYLDGKSVFIQPTTYSDKTKFLMYEVDISEFDLKSKTFDEYIENRIIEHVGGFYRKSYENVLSDYKKLFSDPVVYVNLINKLGAEIKLNPDNIHSINNILKKLELSDLLDLLDVYNKSHEEKLNLTEELHYRVIGDGKLSINELLYEFANNLYTPEKLKQRLKKEKLQFAKDLMSKQVTFLMTGERVNTMERFAKQILGNDFDKWVEDSYLIIGKIKNTKTGKVKNITYENIGDLKEGETFELNPALDRYFMLDIYLGNNLRYSLTGSEINHKIKYLSKQKLFKGGELNLYRGFIKTYNPEYDGGDVVTMSDLSAVIENVDKLIKQGKTLSSSDLESFLKLKKLYDSEIYKLENLAQNAQFKRNVIIPGTIHPYKQNMESGIPPMMKIAVIEDVKAPVFNLEQSDEVDAHDGSALINPFWSILENNSLINNEVGDIKKPIHHFFDHRTGCSTLLKYAVDNITNYWMRLSEGNVNGIKLKNIFKKMTDLRWEEPDGTLNYGGKIELAKLSGPKTTASPTKTEVGFDFIDDILQGDLLYYKKGNKHYKIVNFGEENGIYYTEEQEVSYRGSELTPKVRIYHYFDEGGNYTRSTELHPELKSINSLYQLHTVLGGIYSESKSENGDLSFSEISNKIVTRFIINTVVKQPDGSYKLPLKEAMIGMIANKSAVKNGASNVNLRSSWTDENEKLRYMVVSTENYGIQLDADHEADMSEMTEFSQVISALDAGGRLHNYIAQIYKTLGEVALLAALIELKALETYRKTGNSSDIYDIIGRVVMKSMLQDSTGAGLAESILNTIKEKFNANLDHADDELHIPFSDSNLYKKILSSFVSIINKKSIKRKYPGTGTPLVPAYNMTMVYELDRELQFEDVLKRGISEGIEDEIKADIEEGKIAPIESTAKYNLEIATRYLRKALNKHESDFRSTGECKSTEFMVPADNYVIKFKRTLENGEVREEECHVALNTREDFYLCTSNIHKFLAEKGFVELDKKTGLLKGVDGNSFEYFRDLTRPRNLKPFEYTFEYVDKNGIRRKRNLFTHWKVKNFILGKLELEKNLKKELKDKTISKESALSHYNLGLQQLYTQYNTQSALDELEAGVYVDEDGTSYQIDPESVKSKAAECIMSNIYKSQFGIGESDSLEDVMKNPKYFKFKLEESVKLVNSDNFDLVFTKANGRHLYITFKEFSLNNNTGFTRASWRETVKKEFTPPKGYVYQEGDPVIINSVYASKDNVPLFEIGREILRSDLYYDADAKAYKFKESSETHKAGDVAPNQNNYKRNGNEVIEYVEFISKYKVYEKRTNRSIVLQSLNINKSALSRVFIHKPFSEKDLTRKNGERISIDDKKKSEINNFVGVMLGEIYKANDYSSVQINTRLHAHSRNSILNSLNSFAYLIRHNAILYEYITEKVKGALETGVAQEDGYYLLSTRKLKLDNYVNKVAEKQKVSFLKALMFTAARIPAQTLQSFMKMKNVGFTGTGTNQCFVSHWQTWLQGSDYDIDKAYMMGLSFNSLGMYQGWSNLFDYSSIELLNQSEYLPMPSGKHYIKSENALDITKYVEKIAKASTKLEELRGYCELLNFLEENESKLKVPQGIGGTSKTYESFYVNYNHPEGDKVLAKINLHESTKIPESLKEEVLKNFISSHILNTVLNIRNYNGAYSPISMDDIRDTLDLSPKQAISNNMTLLNPTTKLLMQYQNITGKNVIGIAANGEKASFMWHYYINDIMRHPNERRLKYALFEFRTERLLGRSSNNLQTSIVKTLPELLMEGIKDDIKAKFLLGPTSGVVYRPLTVDLIISQILSAATDNAKELILAKINAGNKLAKMYLFLVTLGYNLKDTVSFMTSDAISFIDAITEDNIFKQYHLSITDAIQIARGDYNTLITRYLGDKENFSEKVQTALDELRFSDIKISDITTDIKGSPRWLRVAKGLHILKLIKSLQNYDINDEGIKKDIDEFEHILKGANEFTCFATMLGLNLGFKTSKEELLAQFTNFAKLYNEAFGTKMDVGKFFSDPEYRNQIINNYENKKVCINPYAIISHIPQFKAILQLADVVIEFDRTTSMKSKIYDKIYANITEQYKFINKTYPQLLLYAIDDLFISNFIMQSDIFIPYPGGSNLLSVDRRAFKLENASNLHFNTLTDAASFKMLFENTIAPYLKSGIYFKYDSKTGEVVQVKDPNLLNNKFIKALFKGNERDTPVMQIDLNMMAIEVNAANKKKFHEYSEGLRELQKIRITDDYTLADLIALYNLITNKNRYGKSKLTTLFDSIIQSGNEKSLIAQYLAFVGDIDRNATISDDPNVIEINHRGLVYRASILDVLMRAAKIVPEQQTRNLDPVVIKFDSYDNVYRYYTSNGDVLKYDPIPKIEGESPDDYLIRFKNNIGYFVLGGTYLDDIENKLEKLRSLSNSTIDILWDLSREGVIRMTKICK